MLFKPRKQLLFGIFNIFKECKGVLSTFEYTLLVRHKG